MEGVGPEMLSPGMHGAVTLLVRGCVFTDSSNGRRADQFNAAPSVARGGADSRQSSDVPLAGQHDSEA